MESDRMKPPAPLWDVKQVATYLKVSPRHVSNLTKNEGLPHVKVGRLVRYRPGDVEEWLIATTKVEPIEGVS